MSKILPYLLAATIAVVPNGETGDKPKLKKGCATFDQAQLIRIIAEYDVHHFYLEPVRTNSRFEHPPQTFQLNGHTSTGRKQILLNVYQDPDDRIKTTIHEVYHLVNFYAGYKNDEGTIRKCADKKYKELFEK